MLRPGFQNDFAIAFRRVVMKKESVILHNVKIGTNGSTITLNVTVQWIVEPEALFGKVLIVFTDVANIVTDKTPSKRGKQYLASIREKELEEALQHAREEVQNILEEMQTSQEELKSSNEELQSTNEELQSTNEELTTSKEEMQSLNEELQTVNAELQSKVDDYSRVNNDMKNLLNSTDIATLFLDKELNIRQYTNQATKIFKLIKGDVGRPFTDQASHLIYPELAADALEVLRTLIFVEKQIPTKDGRWFLARIMPYRTFDDRIDGLVLTFINITDSKQIEESVNETNQMFRLLLNSSSDVIVKLSTDWEILEFNSAAENLFGIKHSNVINQKFIELFVPKSLRAKSEQQLNQLLTKADTHKVKMKIVGADGIELNIEMMVDVVFNSQNLPSAVLFTTKKMKP
jgi:two-component system CheB/CheR fusion protein